MRLPLALVCSLVLVGAFAGPVRATPELVDLTTDASGPISSDNVTYVGTIPLDSPGIGGEVVNHKNGKRYFYASGVKGLSIYDISDPALPLPVSFTPFPHSQNEDLKVSDDGTRSVISADGSLLVPIMPATTGITLFDTTDPANPKMIGSTSPLLNGSGAGVGVSEHTAECADAACNVIYGRTGRIYDARQLPVIKEMSQRWNIVPETGKPTTQAHALNRDDSGLIVADTTPRLVLDPSADPLNPRVLATGPVSRDDSRLQHNNVRTDVAQWSPRAPDDPVERSLITPNPRSVSVTDERPVLRPGELLIGNSESNLNRNCSNAGGLSTWSMANFDQGAPLEQLEVFRPLNGTWLDGSPAVNGLGCSGHWFTERGGIVAASWYEHGVRFFSVDKASGALAEVGYFQPGATEAGAAYWIDDEYVYSVDYARGIDILKFDRADAPATQAELDASWLANLGRVGSLASKERFICALGGQ